MENKKISWEKAQQIILSFLKLGSVAFGGPAVSYALMREEFVMRKKWLDEATFFDFLGIANLVPGPNATEMAILIGYHHAGFWGMLLAGVCLVVPAMLIVMGFAWFYVSFGTLPVVNGILYGVKPIVLAIILFALWGLVKPRSKEIPGMAIAGIILVAYLLGFSPIVLMLGGGLLLGLITYLKNNHWKPLSLFLLSPLLGQKALDWTLLEDLPFNLLRLFWAFLKAGALMYGSGYVLLAFIHEDLVVRLGWISDSLMIDAIAVGQVTPGPLFTTATFIGYVLGGIPAALIATLGMFLPSLLIIGVMILIIDKVRNARRLSGFLQGVNFAALGLMAGVTWEIGKEAIIDPLTALTSVVALLLLIRFKISSPWLILGGIAMGLIRMIIIQ